MNEWLAQMYGTNGARSEEQEKLASLELFAKLAAKHNIDLSQLSDDQVNELFAQTLPEEYAKYAQEAEKEDKEEEEEEKEEGEEEKKEKAEEYVEEKKAFQEKCAEADYMGRVMAHAFVQEREEIEKSAGRVSELAGRARGLFKKAPEFSRSGGRSVLTPTDKLQNLRVAAKGKYKELGGAPGIAKAIGKHPATIAAGGAAAGAGGAVAAQKMKEKKSSAQAFEELAANQAIKVASAAGYDSGEVFNRVNAVYILGLEDTEKVASVQNVDDALYLRGLEYLEAAGYPVNWSEIYG